MKHNFDSSAVFHVEMLDTESVGFDPACPWILETDEDGAQFYATEDEACAAQRAYRAAHGFDPETGERA
jgi:hypothetical protein